MERCDMVLYNEFGCELDRVTIESNEEMCKELSGWSIGVGDYIKFEDTWHEEFEEN